MVGRRANRRPPPLEFLTVARDVSPSCSTLSSSDWDADDEGAMSSGSAGDGGSSSRPLSVAIPDGPYYPRRPTLAEILSNQAPPPWTLSAFMAFLSQNHCLETLEFTMDASRYQRQYEDVIPTDHAPHHHHHHMDTEDAAPAREYVQMLWRRLLDAYIVPNGPREVNLPGDVRDRLLSLANDLDPPSPRSLEPAVKIVYDLMDESVLVPFLNSLSAPRPSPAASSFWPARPFPADHSRAEDDAMHVDGNSGDDTSREATTRSRRGRGAGRSEPSPTPSSDGMDSVSSSGSTGRRSRSRRRKALALGVGSRGPHATTTMGSGPSAAGSGGDSLTDDSASPSSPGREEPMTPPTTPPTSDLGLGGGGGGSSPRGGGRTDRTWRKMTDRLGWRKKSNNTLRDGNGGGGGGIPPHSHAYYEDEAGAGIGGPSATTPSSTSSSPF